jgi:ADP-ribose pyrophosphatase
MIKKEPASKIIPKEAKLIPNSAKRVFKGEIFEVWQWSQKMYDDSTQTFEMLKRPDTVVVIAIQDENIIITRQRQPNLPDEFMDFPGGRADDGEEPLESAKREMLEETGMAFNNWKLIDIVQPISKIEWFVYTYLATDFLDRGETKHDAGEKIKVLSMDIEDIKKIEGRNARFDQGIFKKFTSLHDLLAAPEYKGRKYYSDK